MPRRPARAAPRPRPSSAPGTPPRTTDTGADTATDSAQTPPPTPREARPHDMRSIIFYGQTGKFTWRMLATVLGGESVCVLLAALVARGVTATDDPGARSTVYLLIGFGLGAL